MSLIARFERQRERLSAGGAEGPWLLVFDIDSTLMDTGPRNVAILKAALEALPGLGPWKDRPSLSGTGWNILEPLEAAGLRDAALLAQVREFWRRRFFTDQWLVHDQPYPGVAACLQGLKTRGFRLVYLTGRHSPGMEEGTRQSFAGHGLPAGSEEAFVFKPSFEEEDLAFKTRACREIAGWGTVAGSLDNEPGNANLLARSFPKALNLWMRTITSPHPEPLDAGVAAVGPEAFLGPDRPGSGLHD